MIWLPVARQALPRGNYGVLVVKMSTNKNERPGGPADRRGSSRKIRTRLYLMHPIAVGIQNWAVIKANED